MVEFKEIFNEWWKPVFQSVVGAFLFWLILKYAPLAYGKLNAKYAKRSLVSKEKLLTYQITKYKALTSEGADRSTYFSALIYAANRELIKGLIWLTLGLVTMSVIPIFGVVGFIGAFYFFIKAASVTAPIDTAIDKEEKLEELKIELKEIKNSLNKGSQ
ncbi:hypothetical protein HXW73_10025 [Halomonas sp. SH5A2]|uniref:hypothetical protein n=1 Tax=Halomonas sp. SH5A2 TaxID=2749040 RepID=UPI00163E3199|nr:hypothetical protein [Halomonas sp. SH5A2]QNI03238.1 hypothetical protein HXW73_10025 [Halomonas sp. SH5A2]